MYFYVFLQPEIFGEATSDGEDAEENVAAILSAFLQNCFLAVFEDDRWGPSVREKLEEWPETMTRRRVMSMLVHLKKQSRFLYCISPDYIGEKRDLDCVFEQAAPIRLDLMLVISSEGGRAAPAGAEVATRRTYQHTTFEQRRSQIAVYGKTCGPGEMDEISFMEFHFEKALKHAATIHICDRVCGKKSFADNYRYTIRKLMAWLGSILSDPINCKIVFHLGQPRGLGAQFILHELASFKSGPLNGATIEVHFYDESLPNPTLPHQRFIVTDQISLDVDRGLDFLDRMTQRCRDTYVNYQDPKDAQRLLRNYSSGCISTHIV